MASISRFSILAGRIEAGVEGFVQLVLVLSSGQIVENVLALSATRLAVGNDNTRSCSRVVFMTHLSMLSVFGKPARWRSKYELKCYDTDLGVTNDHLCGSWRHDLW